MERSGGVEEKVGRTPEENQWAILSCKIRETKARRRLLTNPRTVLNDSQPIYAGSRNVR